MLERFQNAKRREQPDQASVSPHLFDRDSPLSAEESAHWATEFAELESAPDTKEVFSPGSTLLTDAEIARIQKEIESES